MRLPAGAGGTLIHPSRAPGLVRTRWGLVGLVLFEAILAAYTLANGAWEYGAMALFAAAALLWALAGHAREGTIPKAALAALLAVTLWRAARQTVLAPVFGPAGVWPTWLVPLGFALLLVPGLRPAIGLGAVAAARTWFVLWYVLQGSVTLALANLVGAVGAWLWWSGESAPERPAPADETAPQP